jgi:DNA primase
LAWDSVRHFSTVLLVQGLFDLAVLWQAGFRNTTCVIGTHLSSAHVAQLSEPLGRRVYIAFDRDDNGRRRLICSLQLKGLGLPVHIVQLPQGLDPNSYSVSGATAADFTAYWERAQPL